MLSWDTFLTALKNKECIFLASSGKMFTHLQYRYKRFPQLLFSNTTFKGRIIIVLPAVYVFSIFIFNTFALTL